MQFQVKHRITDAVMFECELPSEIAERTYSFQLGFAVKKANLAGANLADANLAGVRNVPDGTQATSPAEPYQRAVTPQDYAARAARYRERHPDVPVVEALDRRILQVIESGQGRLDMSSWHICETTHCRAGWAIHLAGDAGAKLETEYGPAIAGRMIYLASTGRATYFYATDERALQDLRERAAEQV